MGKAKEKRPMLLPEGFQGASTTVFSMSSGGALVVGGALTGSSAVTASGTLTASSSGNVVGGLTVGGTLTGSSNMSITGTGTVGGTFTASSSGSVAGGLTVSGTLTGSSNMSITGTGTVSGTFTASSSGSVAGGLTVSGTLTGSSNATVSGTLTGSSNATISGTLTGSSALKVSVQSVSTGVALGSQVVTILTATGSTSYTLPAVSEGLHKIVMKTANSTAILTVDTNATGQTLDGSSATKLTFNGLNQRVELVGASSTRWLILSSTASVGDIST